MGLQFPIAVLCSGGLDSAVLLVDTARTAGGSTPIFVRGGHLWEPSERAALQRFLAAVDDPRIAAIHDLALPMTDVYGPHWSITGHDSPTWSAPDETVELPGRNLILLTKAAVLAAINGWSTIAIGTLAGNPFPDATPEFFQRFADVASTGLRTRIEIIVPFRNLTKAEVIRRGADLPLELTLSCLHPTPDGLHCGDCNKCRERVEAFAASGVPDRTVYARRR